MLDPDCGGSTTLELGEAASGLFHLLSVLAEAVLGGLEAVLVDGLWLGLVAAVTAVSQGLLAAWLTLHAALRSLSVFFNLLGRRNA
jgi:hypothetical protein